jgi:hypothetical protein
MTPYYFGDSKCPLFGCYLPPAGAAARDHGVLVCSPIAQEYVRAHWAVRQLSSALSRAGFHVFRFDYSAVGDSALPTSEATVARWREDVELAAEELRDNAGVRTLSLVGLRLGAALAVGAVTRLRARDVVLWDPVVSGKRYLEELGGMHASLLKDPRRFAFSLGDEYRLRLAPLLPSLSGPTRSGSDELLGFAFPRVLRKEIAALDLPRAAAGAAKPPPGRTVMVLSEDRDEYRELEQALRGAGHRLDVMRASTRGRWGELEEIENALLPGDVPRLVAGALGGAR